MKEKGKERAIRRENKTAKKRGRRKEERKGLATRYVSISLFKVYMKRTTKLV